MNKSENINNNNAEIKSTESVTLLGIEFDNKLNFENIYLQFVKGQITN